MHSAKKTHQYFRRTETGAFKDKITCLGLQKCSWGKKKLISLYSQSHPIPMTFSNNPEVVCSKPKYLKPYVQLVSAQMT